MNSLPTITVALLLVTSSAFADSGILPDPARTPGAVRTSNIGEICNEGSTRSLRHWSRDRDDFILREYGLPAGPHPDFEIDHLIALGIGGADDDQNLWPEPRRSIEPTYNAEAKDRLEWKLRDLVCSGDLDVTTAQKMITDDWTAAYAQFFPASRVNAFPPAVGATTPK
jgi:hypothetical protein